MCVGAGFDVLTIHHCLLAVSDSQKLLLYFYDQWI